MERSIIEALVREHRESEAKEADRRQTHTDLYDQVLELRDSMAAHAAMQSCVMRMLEWYVFDDDSDTEYVSELCTTFPTLARHRRSTHAE